MERQAIRCPECWKEIDLGSHHEPANFCPRCQFPLKRVAGVYQLEAKIGAGAFGTVYRGRHVETQELRAIKVLRWDTASSNAPESWGDEKKQKKQREFEARFEREIELTAALARQSWHIVHLDSAGSDEVLGLYYVMEYLEGAQLRQLLTDWPWVARERAFSIMRQLCEGVAVAHRAGVIHRDLKPENVVLLKQESAGRTVKILDFGLARLVRESNWALTSRPMGTPLYMSPEQCANRSMDERADIYALGAVMFHLLTGTPPFHDAADTTHLLMQHLHSPPPSLRQRCPELPFPEGLDRVLQSAMAKEPKQRYPTVEALWQALKPYAHWRESSLELQLDDAPPGPRRTETIEAPKAEALEPPLAAPPSDSFEDFEEPDFPSYTRLRRQSWKTPLFAVATLVGVWLGILWSDGGSPPPASMADSAPATPAAPKAPPARASALPKEAQENAGTVRPRPAKVSKATPARRRPKARRKVSPRRRKARVPRSRSRARWRQHTAWVAQVRLKQTPQWPGAERARIPSGVLLRKASGTTASLRISRSFWMWRTEITQGQFQAVMGYNPSRFKKCGGQCPVESLSWHEAAAFTNAISRLQGLPGCYSCTGSGRQVWCSVQAKYRASRYTQCRGWRLPTEAEWEYAYKAGSRGRYYTGECLLSSQANFDGSRPASHCPAGKRRGSTTSVAGFRANGWGLYDMAGNVWEWVYDGYHPQAASTSRDPHRAPRGRRVVKGGGWYSPASECTARSRESFSPTKRSLILGFRAVRTR